MSKIISKVLAAKPTSRGQQQRDSRQLHRLESLIDVVFALVGFSAAAAWWYASYDRRLLTPEVDDADVNALRLRVLAEPLTAATGDLDQEQNTRE